MVAGVKERRFNNHPGALARLLERPLLGDGVAQPIMPHLLHAWLLVTVLSEPGIVAEKRYQL